MDTAQELEVFAKEKLRTILKDSGHVLYSSAETLCQGGIYLLGHNPGGSPEGREDESIENSLHNLAAKKTNEYLDDSWNGLAPGEAVLQKRVRWLLEQLNMDVREVCASNLIFSRSVDAKSSNFKNMANLCWPVHEYILRTVKPKIILAFGNSKESPFFFLQEKLGVDDDKIIPPHGSGHGSGDDEWKCKAFYTPTNICVVGLPHLSRYAVNHHEDVPKWIKSLHSGRGGVWGWFKSFMLGIIIWLVLTFLLGLLISFFPSLYFPEYSNVYNFILYPVGIYLGFKITKTSFWGNN